MFMKLPKNYPNDEAGTYPWILASSEDPTEIAARVKAIVMMFSSLITFVAFRYYGITMTPDDVISLASEIGIIASFIYLVWASLLRILALFKR